MVPWQNSAVAGLQVLPCREETAYPAVAVGGEEPFGQGLRVDGLQESLQRHAFAVHPARPHTFSRTTTIGGNSLQQKPGPLRPNTTVMPLTLAQLPVHCHYVSMHATLKDTTLHRVYTDSVRGRYADWLTCEMQETEAWLT